MGQEVRIHAPARRPWAIPPLKTPGRWPNTFLFDCAGRQPLDIDPDGESPGVSPLMTLASLPHGLYVPMAARVESLDGDWADGNVDPLLCWANLRAWIKPRKSAWVIGRFAGIGGHLARLNDILEAGWKAEFLIAMSTTSPFILKLSDERGRQLTILDIANWFRAANLSGLAPDFQPAHQPPVNDPEVWPDFLAQSTIPILRGAVTALQSIARDSVWAMGKTTVAGMAWATWRQPNYFPAQESRPRVHLDQPALDLERSVSLAGRCDLFWAGEVEQPVFRLDVNSMYPYIMRGPLPVELAGYDETNPARFVDESRAAGHMVIVDCDLETRDDWYTVPVEDGLYYSCNPVGRFRVTLTDSEFRMAESAGHIQRIHRAASYRPGHPLTDYVDQTFAIRSTLTREYGPAGNLLGKLMLNAMFGKLGQQRVGWEPAPDDFDLSTLEDGDLVDIPPREGVRIRKRLGLLQVESPKGETAYSCPAIAAHIAGRGRVILQGLIQEVRASGGRVFYCDTDGLIVDRAGYEALHRSIGPALGNLKLEAEAERVWLIAPKQYVFGSHATLAGVPIDHTDPDNPLAAGYSVQHAWVGSRIATVQERAVRLTESTGSRTKKTAGDGWTSPPVWGK